MKKNRILVIDDDPSVREFVCQILSENYRVDLAPSGEVGLELAGQVQPSLILLDIVMPGLSGVETLRRLRSNEKTSDVPVIMLTALNDADQRVEAFSAGADDYISKPFRADELLVRADSKLKRMEKAWSSQHDVLRLGNLAIHLLEFTVTIENKPLDMGQVEFKILSLLARRQGQLIKREEIEDFIWGNEKPSGRALDPHITSLRKKLQNSDADLKTVYGTGYSLIVKNT